MFHKSVRQECPTTTRVSYQEFSKKGAQECPTREYKSVPQECPTTCAVRSVQCTPVGSPKHVLLSLTQESRTILTHLYKWVVRTPSLLQQGWKTVGCSITGKSGAKGRYWKCNDSSQHDRRNTMHVSSENSTSLCSRYGGATGVFLEISVSWGFAAERVHGL